jgi:hypothetical protein
MTNRRVNVAKVVGAAYPRLLRVKLLFCTAHTFGNTRDEVSSAFLKGKQLVTITPLKIALYLLMDY